MLERTDLAPHAVGHWAERTPDSVALEHIDGHRRTYAELDEDGRTFAAAFAGLGIDAGTHVATMLPNDFHAHQTMLGLAWLRAIEVPLNTAYRGQMLQYTLGRAEVSFVITTTAFWDVISEVATECPQIEHVVVLDAEAPGRLDGIDVHGSNVVSEAEPAAGLDGPDVWDVAALLFTSGTTGPSKAVITPWGFIYQFWSWVPDDTVHAGEGLYCALTMFHGAGRSGFNYAMSRGARLIIRDKFSVTHFLDDVRRTDAKSAALIGPLTSVLHSTPEAPDDADNPLRSVILGPMIPDIERFETRFGVKVATCYGQTEIGSPITTGFDHGPWQTSGTRRTTYPHPEVRLVDEHDLAVPIGEVGELIVRADEPWGMNLGYHGDPDASIHAWRNGWFHTGDAFRRDEEGRYYFVDRMSDTIRRRGENISSFEVEDFVRSSEAVADCAAFAVPNEHGDDEVMVTVVPTGDVETFSLEALIEHLVDRMPSFMVPRYLDIVTDLPRTEASNRVRKAVLRERGVTPTTWDRQG